MLLPDEELIELWQELVVPQNADVTLSIVLLQPGTTLPFDLTNCTVTVVVKPSRYSADGIGQSFIATVTNAPGGLASLVIPAASVGPVGIAWYRVDVTSGISRISPIFGPFNVQAV